MPADLTGGTFCYHSGFMSAANCTGLFVPGSGPSQSPVLKCRPIMDLFFFAFEATPTAASPQATDLAGADIHIWVQADSMAGAESTARQHIMDFAWVVKELSLARHWPLERIPDLHKDEQALAQRAIRFGVAADFLAWPKEANPGEDPLEVRSAGSPRTKPPTKH